MTEKQGMGTCPYAKKCGGCEYQGIPYEKQLESKQRQVEALLAPFCKVHPITGMENPYHYRHKVHAVLGRTPKGEIISGVYEEGSHRIVPVEHCQIEEESADAVIADIKQLIRSFRLPVYTGHPVTGSAPQLPLP